ncbi:MAG: HAD-IIA family hydrolase [Planctomycetota bacterium]
MTEALPSFLRDLRHIAFDLDGTLYIGSRVFPFTVPFLKQLDRLNIGTTFITNNSSRSVEQYQQHLRGMGIDAARDQIYTSGLATIAYLKQERADLKRLFIVGTSGLMQEFRAAGFEIVSEDAADEPDAVIVGYDPELDFARLCKGAYWIERGCDFVATHPDQICPTDLDTLLIDCGSLCRCLEEATGRQPDRTLGKPDPAMLAGVLARHQLRPFQLAMVGDRITTDMEMARRAGARSILVLSGETTPEQTGEADLAPDLVVRDIGELGRILTALPRRS